MDVGDMVQKMAKRANSDGNDASRLRVSSSDIRQRVRHARNPVEVNRG